ncbi:MAG: metallophosphoesterase [Candidatus Bathyarchaeota archaeon]
MSENSLRPLIPLPAILIEENSNRILVVTDLHIGWEVSLVEKGIYLPSQISRIQTKLIQLIEESNPSQLIFLGDIKQNIPRISFVEWKNVPEFFESLQKYVSDISVIVGNHDGDLEPLTPTSIKIYASGGIVVGKAKKIGLLHGHAWPSPEVLSCETIIMGHVHPLLWVKDKIGFWTVHQVWVKTICNSENLAKAYLKYRNNNVPGNAKSILKEKYQIEIKEPRLIIMPAFNELVGGISLNRFDNRLISPILNSRCIDLNEVELYLLDGTFIGTLGQVRKSIGS